MGVAITDLLVGKEITFDDLRNKTIVIDGFNQLYQFLTVLRGPDGGPLTNSKGEITSHLQGLLSRVSEFLSYNINVIYVFDGKPPKEKQEENQRRSALKKDAQEKYDIAKERNDFEGMRKYAQRLISVTPEVLESTKKFLTYLGIPYVQAPSEGEAQAGEIVKQGLADYVVSQDADAMLFGAPLVIRNLSLGGSKKMTGKLTKKKITPMMYSLNDTLEKHGLTIEQMRIIALLTGTDFNVGGVKGLGPKKSLKLVKEKSEDEIFSEVEWNFTDWKHLYSLFENMPVEKNLDLKFRTPDIEGLAEWLSSDYGFTKERVLKSFEKVDIKQKGLGDFFGSIEKF